MNTKIVVSSNPADFDIKVIHNVLTHSYWANGRSMDTVISSIKNSLCFALFSNEAQVGFARVISDYSTVSYICDVFVLQAHQNQGIGKILMKTILENEKLKTTKFFLLTKDAHDFYSYFGFQRNTEMSARFMNLKKETQS